MTSTLRAPVTALCFFALAPMAASAQEAPAKAPAPSEAQAPASGVDAIPFAGEPEAPKKARRKKKKKAKKPAGRFEWTFGGGWQQEAGEAGQGGGGTTRDGSPIGTALSVPDASADGGAATIHTSLRVNAFDFGRAELDFMVVDAGASFGAAPVVNIGAFAPELYFRAGDARIGFGVAPELQVALVNLGEVGKGRCPSRQAFQDGQCESATEVDAYYGNAAGPYTSGSQIDAVSLAFAVRPYVRVSYDMADFIGVAVTAGYRFLGTHDDYKVQIDTPEEGNPRDLGSSALGGADLGTLQTAGFGLRAELYFTNGK